MAPGELNTNQTWNTEYTGYKSDNGRLKGGNKTCYIDQIFLSVSVKL